MIRKGCHSRLSADRQASFKRESISIWRKVYFCMDPSQKESLLGRAKPEDDAEGYGNEDGTDV